MANDKVLIFGGGYLGNRIRDHFGENALISTADITDLEAVKEAIQASQPHVVINAAAKTLTGELEKPENQAEGYRVNVQGAANIAYACHKAGIFMAHISTGMMFDGPDVKETETPKPTNYYAWTKAWADAQLFPLMGNKIMIVRIHTPLSKYANPRNLLTKLQGFDKVVGEPSSLTVVEDFLAALEQLVEKRASGIYNVVNPGSISLYEVVKLMQQNGLVDPAKEVKELSREQLQEMVASSGGAHQTYPILSTEKLSALGISMRPVREAVEASIKEYES